MAPGVPLLLPIDTNAPSQLAVQLAAVLGSRLSDEVLLLHVSEQPPPLDRLADLHSLGEPIRERGVPVRLRVVRGLPAERIPEIARERDVNWILMGTSGEDFRARGGSVARAVMRASSVPVIAVRPGRSAPSNAPIAMIGVPPAHPARDIARVLADAHGVPTREHGPDLAPHDGLPRSDTRQLTIAPFDPDCTLGTWCGALLAQEPHPVVLVSGDTCACGPQD